MTDLDQRSGDINLTINDVRNDIEDHVLWQKQSKESDHPLGGIRTADSLEDEVNEINSISINSEKEETNYID